MLNNNNGKEAGDAHTPAEVRPMKLTQHALSASFPAMQADERLALTKSITENGVLNAITLFQGEVIDGYNRYEVACELGLDCPAVELKSDIDPVDFVKSQNLHRRHLTGSQRAAAVVACSNWQPAYRPIKSVSGTDLPTTDAQMAKEAGVSISTVGHAKVAQKAGLLESVRDGALSAKKAAMAVRGTASKSQHKPAKKQTFAGLDETDADELTELRETIIDLSHEVEQLKAQIAIGSMDGTCEEKSEAATIIAELRAKVKTLGAELDAMRVTRDGFQAENYQLRKQCEMQRRQLDKGST